MAFDLSYLKYQYIYCRQQLRRTFEIYAINKGNKVNKFKNIIFCIVVASCSDLLGNYYFLEESLEIDFEMEEMDIVDCCFALGYCCFAFGYCCFAFGAGWENH